MKRRSSKNCKTRRKGGAAGTHNAIENILESGNLSGAIEVLSIGLHVQPAGPWLHFLALLVQDPALGGHKVADVIIVSAAESSQSNHYLHREYGGGHCRSPVDPDGEIHHLADDRDYSCSTSLIEPLQNTP